MAMLASAQVTRKSAVRVEGGAPLWCKKVGNGNLRHGYSAAVDAAGNTSLLGRFTGTLDLGGEPLTSPGEVAVFGLKLGDAGVEGGDLGVLLAFDLLGGGDVEHRDGVVVDRAEILHLAAIDENLLPCFERRSRAEPTGFGLQNLVDTLTSFDEKFDAFAQL